MQNASAFCFNGKKINTKQTKVVKKEKKKKGKTCVLMIKGRLIKCSIHKVVTV